MEMERMSRDMRSSAAVAVSSRIGDDPYRIGVDDRSRMGVDDSRARMDHDRSARMDRSKSPVPDFNVRSAVEIAELQDKLEKTNNELRRAQAELRLNQSDYDRSHVELEQLHEKVRARMRIP